tara:strand:+ start:2803 stop:3120 length:318 start_codon:yes stop_codon:yes gene_type:complete
MWFINSTNMSVIKTLTHRGVDYDYHEWTTWNGKPASGYTITNHPTFAITSPRVQQLAAQTKEQAIAKIDDYFDREDHYKEMAKLHDAGCQAYYDSKTRWDNFTGD